MKKQEQDGLHLLDVKQVRILESVANILRNLILFTKHTDMILKDSLNQEPIHLYYRIFKISGNMKFDVGNSFYELYVIFNILF